MSAASPTILFVRGTAEDYLSDSLLHGLRTLLGAAVVDFPKADALYDSYPVELRGQLYGRGFSLYNTLPDIPIDRSRIESRVAAGEFDYVVFGDIHRTPSQFLSLAPLARSAALVAVDGQDIDGAFPRPIHLKHNPLLITAPRRFALYFKREWTRETLRGSGLRERAYRSVAVRISADRMRRISFSIPESKLLAPALSPTAKRTDFPSHIVDPEMARALGATSSYAFHDEKSYYANLAEARFGITTKRAGWDCMRHYEIAANGSVPCFRDLDKKDPTCAPHGLDASNSITYRDADELLRIVRTITDAEYAALREGSLRWARRNTTAARAREFLDEIAAARVGAALSA